MHRSSDPLEKVTINLVDGDKDILAAFHPDLGWSVAARRVIHNYCLRLQEEEQRLEKHDTTDIEVPKLSKL